MSEVSREVPPRVGVEVVVAVLGGVLGILAFDSLLPDDGVRASVVDPVLVVSVCLAGMVGYLVANVEENHRENGLPYRSLGIANGLTVLRGGLFAAVAGFAVVPKDTGLAWVPALCYGLGAALDGLDGTVARTVGRQTPLGRRLDMAFDTFGFVVAPVVAVVWGQLPVWYLSLSAARYVYRGGVYWRRRRGRPVFEAPANDIGRYLAGGQMVFLTLALAPVVPTALVTAAAPAVLVPSLAVFLRDYLVVAGWFRATGTTELTEACQQ